MLPPSITIHSKLELFCSSTLFAVFFRPSRLFKAIVTMLIRGEITSHRDRFRPSMVFVNCGQQEMKATFLTVKKVCKACRVCSRAVAPANTPLAWMR